VLAISRLFSARAAFLNDRFSLTPSVKNTLKLMPWKMKPTVASPSSFSRWLGKVRPPKKVPPQPPISSTFKIRLLAGLTGSAGPAQVENIVFQIADTKNKVTAFYTYTSEGVGKGLIKGLNLSATMKGPWNDFRTTSDVRVSQFEGAARFTTGGVGPWTSNHLNMMGLPKDVSTVPAVLDIQTGLTIGIGASTSVGKMTWVPREEMIYAGD
jgi:hypothetical protein